MEYSSLQACLVATGTRVPYGICQLAKMTFRPSPQPVNAGTQFSDCLHTKMVYAPKDGH